jgi:hypothetical protein
MNLVAFASNRHIYYLIEIKVLDYIENIILNLRVSYIDFLKNN